MQSFMKWKDLCHVGVDGCEGGKGVPLRPILYMSHGVYNILPG